MNGLNSTRLSYLEEPEKLSKKELLAAFKNIEDVAMMQNQKLREVKSKLSETCTLANTLADHLWTLVDSFEENNQAAIADQLGMLSERRKSFKKPEVH